MTEARTSHAANLETVARATAGGYIISGEKTSVTMLANAEAIILAVTKVGAARMICYAALEKRTLGLPHTIDAAMAKWYGPLVASAAVKERLLLHGNYGYSQELPFEQRLRHVMSVEIVDGTARIQKVIMRERYGTDFVPYELERCPHGLVVADGTGPSRALWTVSSSSFSYPPAAEVASGRGLPIPWRECELEPERVRLQCYLCTVR